MRNNLNKNINILEQKVLKKNDNNSRIDIDMFIVVEEEIGKITYTQQQPEEKID